MAQDPLALPDLAVRSFGGAVVWANDELFAGRENLVTPGPAVFTPRTFGAKGQVYDGWETRRRREPGHDWAVLELGAFGRIEEVTVDTAHFKGNYPDRCSIQASARAHGSPEEIAAQAETWPVLLPEVKLGPDQVLAFRDELAAIGPVRFVRLNIYPDGGVSRLRMLGTLAG